MPPKESRTVHHLSGLGMRWTWSEAGFFFEVDMGTVYQL